MPWFSTWILFGIVYTVALFIVFRLNSKEIYRFVYWTGAFLDLLLQVAVVFEIASYVFRRGDRWVEGARSRFTMMGFCAPLIAGAMAWQMTPAATSAVDAWASRANLFTTVLICVLFSAVMLVSQQVGVGWRDLVLREGYGLMGWAILSFVTDTLHAYWRTIEHFSQLEYLRMAAYLGSLVYWIVIFWLPESSTLPLTSHENKKLQMLRNALHSRKAGRV